LRYYRTTGLILTQMQELVRRVNDVLDAPWIMPTGRPKSLRLYKAVEAACMYLRQNATQEFIGDIRDTSQSTISPLPGGSRAAGEIGAGGVRTVRSRCHRGREGPGYPGRRYADALLVL